MWRFKSSVLQATHGPCKHRNKRRGPFEHQRLNHALLEEHEPPHKRSYVYDDVIGIALLSHNASKVALANVHAHIVSNRANPKGHQTPNTDFS